MAEEVLTDDLLRDILESRDLDAALQAGGASMDAPTLSELLEALLAKYGQKKSKVIRRSHVNETFAYQLFNGSRTHPSRNKVLALALSMGADVHDTRRLLAAADVGDLYAKNRRDAIIVFCVSRAFGVDRTDEELHRFGEETISDASAN